MSYVRINESFLPDYLEFATLSERKFGGIAKQGGVRKYNKFLSTSDITTNFSKKNRLCLHNFKKSCIFALKF